MLRAVESDEPSAKYPKKYELSRSAELSLDVIKSGGLSLDLADLKTDATHVMLSQSFDEVVAAQKHSRKVSFVDPDVDAACMIYSAIDFPMSAVSTHSTSSAESVSAPGSLEREWRSQPSSESSDKPPLKPIMKVRASPSCRGMKRVMEKEVKMLDALIRLKIPIMVTKFDSHGNPGKRLLKLSPDGTDIMWKKQAAAIWSSMPLASVTAIISGPRTSNFKSYDWRTGKPWQCLSLIGTDRTLDLEFSKRREFLDWGTNLLEFIPLSFRNPTKSTMLWKRALFKSVQISLKFSIPIEDVWHVLVSSARDSTTPEENKKIHGWTRRYIAEAKRDSEVAKKSKRTQSLFV